MCAEPLTLDEQLRRLSGPKLVTLDGAVALRHALAAEGRRVVLTNGCFDVLHAGHLYFLQQACQGGDALFVAINSDASVQALKGPLRPVQSELERACALAALACTTAVFIFQEPRLVAEILALRPDRYVKAGDYTVDTLDRGEREALEQVGTDIQILPFLPGFSTTNLIRRIAAAGGTG
jgi:rfaE bifunctional protein nucleotidyltransferase chain/domain